MWMFLFSVVIRTIKCFIEDTVSGSSALALGAEVGILVWGLYAGATLW